MNVEWTELRGRLEQMTLRKATLILIASALVYGLAEIVLLSESATQAMTRALGILIASWMGAAFFSLVTALPGWLIRGAYRFKMVMIVFSFGMMLFSFVALFQLMALNQSVRLLALALLTVFSAAAYLVVFFGLFATVTPDRWSKGVGSLSATLAGLSAAGSLYLVMEQTATERGKTLFNEARISAVERASGSAVTVDALKNEMLAFGAQSELNRVRSKEIAVFDAAPDLAAVRVPSSNADACARAPSTPSRTVASIKFMNRGSTPAQIQWVDFQGLVKPFRWLAAGQFMDQVTYVGHRWIVVDSANNCLGSTSIRDPRHELVVNAPGQ